MNGETIIPTITDPLGKAWNQPHRRYIEIDDSHALMSEQTFKGLSDYSMSNPSGVYEGKMWRSYNLMTQQWYLKWYQSAENLVLGAKFCIHARRILVVD